MVAYYRAHPISASNSAIRAIGSVVTAQWLMFGLESLVSSFQLGPGSTPYIVAPGSTPYIVGVLAFSIAWLAQSRGWPKLIYGPLRPKGVGRVREPHRSKAVRSVAARCISPTKAGSFSGRKEWNQFQKNQAVRTNEP